MSSSWFKVTIFIWWLLNVMQRLRNSEQFTATPRTMNWRIACKYIWFIELTMIQCIIGGITVAVCLKFILKRPVLPETFNRRSASVIAFGNLLGILAMNGMYFMRTLRTGELIRNYEPAIIFLLIQIFGYKQQMHRSTSLRRAGLMVMVIGSCLFMNWDAKFNFWGVFSGFLCTLGFSLRNISLKNLGDTWHDSLQKYSIISIYGFFVLLPLALAKFAYTQKVPEIKLGIVFESTASQIAEGVISISVLESILPLPHAALGTIIRMSATMVTQIYIHWQLSWNVFAGSHLFVLGLVLYYNKPISISGYNLKTKIIPFLIVVNMTLCPIVFHGSERRTTIHETGSRYGVVPYSRAASNSTNILTFHLIFTTTNRTSIELFGNDTGDKVTGAFVWRHWRCVESIFHHHPLARAVIHSNTLSQSTFNVLNESGYDIQVRPYNLVDLAQGTPAEEFVRVELPYVEEGEHWYSHETDLLRLLILYKWGGIYMDTDIIVVRTLIDLPWNILGWESNVSMNGAFLKFVKGHSFLESCLKEFSEHYSQSWGDNGPSLLSRVWRRSGVKTNVTVLPTQAFYMFHYSRIERECFEDTSGNVYENNLKVLRSKAYVVHLNSKITARYGVNKKEIKKKTLCKIILNSFCVLCNKTQ